jgi:hypothetical protein
MWQSLLRMAALDMLCLVVSEKLSFSLQVLVGLMLTISDLKLRQVACEVRYPDAFLVFDKTGDIYHHLASKFTNLHNDSASPTQTQMTADEGAVAVEQQALRLIDNNPDPSLEKFASNLRSFLISPPIN